MGCRCDPTTILLTTILTKLPVAALRISEDDDAFLDIPLITGYNSDGTYAVFVTVRDCESFMARHDLDKMIEKSASKPAKTRKSAALPRRSLATRRSIPAAKKVPVPPAKPSRQAKPPKRIIVDLPPSEDEDLPMAPMERPIRPLPIRRAEVTETLASITPLPSRPSKRWRGQDHESSPVEYVAIEHATTADLQRNNVNRERHIARPPTPLPRSGPHRGPTLPQVSQPHDVVQTRDAHHTRDRVRARDFSRTRDVPYALEMPFGRDIHAARTLPQDRNALNARDIGLARGFPQTQDVPRA